MKRSIDSGVEDSSTKKIKSEEVSPIETDLRKLVPSIADRILSHAFTIAAFAESKQGSSTFLSRMINAFCGFDDDHLYLLPVNKGFQPATKIPICILWNQHWSISMSGGLPHQKAAIHRLDITSADNLEVAFTKIWAAIDITMKKLSDTKDIVLHVYGPFGKMPRNLTLIDVPSAVESSSSIFDQIVDAVITFSNGPVSSTELQHRLACFNKGNPPALIVAHRLGPKAPIEKGVEAAIESLREKAYFDVFLPSSFGDSVLRTSQLHELAQSYTLVHRDIKWEGYRDINEWILELRVRASMHEIENEYTLRNFTDPSWASTVLASNYEMGVKPSFNAESYHTLSIDTVRLEYEVKMKKLCEDHLVDEFSSYLIKRSKSFAFENVYRKVKQWIDKMIPSTRRRSFDVLVRFIILKMHCAHNFDTLKNTKKTVLDVLSHFILLESRKKWNFEEVSSALDPVIVAAFSSARSEVETAYLISILKRTYQTDILVHTMDKMLNDAIEAEWIAFANKYYHGRIIRESLFSDFYNKILP